MKEQELENLGLQLAEETLKAVQVNKRYLKEVLYAVRLFYTWLGQKGLGVSKLGKKDLIAYWQYLHTRKTKLEGRPLSKRTVHGYFQAVRKLYSVLYRSGLIAENPMHGLMLEQRDAPQIKRRPLGVEEIKGLLDGIGTQGQYGLRDRTIYELMYSSGLRVSEAAGLKASDIDFERREILIHGKGRRDRIVPISIVARDFLEAYLAERKGNKDSPVFMGCGNGLRGLPMSGRNISRRFRKLLKDKELDSPEVSAHSIRHSTASHLLENGASIRHVQELLGHKNIEHTARYTEVLTESILKVYRKYHPREHELFEAVDEAYLERFREIVVQGGLKQGDCPGCPEQ